MHLTRISFALALALAACGGAAKTETPAAPALAPAPAAATTGSLELGEITLFVGSNAMFKLHASGASELGGQVNGAPQWKAGPTFKADGTIEENGAAKAKINANGSISGINSSDKVDMVVTVDKATMPLEKGNLEIALAADGKVTITGVPQAIPPDQLPRVEGADTPGKRRTALILMALVLATSAEPQQTPPAPTK